MTTTEQKSMTAAELFAELTGPLHKIFDQIELAEDEIKQAQHRHPAKADEIWHSFKLLITTHEKLSYERIYRAHCREILDRVAAGTDTRPGTAAEVSVACSEASAIGPLGSVVAGLYGRMFSAAMPELPEMFGERQAHHEALEGSSIDDLEADTRHRLRVADRQTDALTCSGQHHGQPVACRFTPAHSAAA